MNDSEGEAYDDGFQEGLKQGRENVIKEVREKVEKLKEKAVEAGTVIRCARVIRIQDVDKILKEMKQG